MTWGKHFILELFLLYSDIQIKRFCLFVGVPRHCCRKAVYVSGSWVWRKPFFCYFSAMNCSYWANKFWLFWANVVARFLKLRLTCPEEQWIREKCFYLIFYTIFGHWARIMGLFGEKFSAGLSKMQSKYQEDEYHEIRILSLFSLELLILSKKRSTFCFKSFSGVFDDASYLSRGAMSWEKHFVLELFLLSSDIQI